MLKTLLLAGLANCHSILDFGNVTQGINPSLEAEKANGAAMVACIQAANATEESSERTCEVPAGVSITMEAWTVS